MPTKTTETTAPDAITSADALALVVRCNGELTSVQAEIATLEVELQALALQDDDQKFEDASLAIERSRRSELRAKARLEAAHLAWSQAEQREEQQRRQAIYAGAQKAAEEAEKLTDEYVQHATAIVEILRRIYDLDRTVEHANSKLPDGVRRLETAGHMLLDAVELPAVRYGGPRFWWKPNSFTPGPLYEQPPRFAPIVVHDAPPPAKERATVLDPDGARRYVLPKNEWAAN